MYKATTPKIKLKIPYTQAEIDSFKLSFVQQGFSVIEKTELSAGIELYDKCVVVTLSQSETNTFVHRYPVNLQMRLKLTNGSVVASAVEQLQVHRVLNDEEL